MPKEALASDPLSRTVKGNLYLKFDIQFPTAFSEETIERLTAILRKNEEELGA
jgi:DnaJ-class molecular chaperone